MEHTTLKRANLDECADNGNVELDKYNHYSLKIYFRTYLGNRDLAEHLMGHTDIANQYCNKQEHEITYKTTSHTQKISTSTETKT